MEACQHYIHQGLQIHLTQTPRIHFHIITSHKSEWRTLELKIVKLPLYYSQYDF